MDTLSLPPSNAGVDSRNDALSERCEGFASVAENALKSERSVSGKTERFGEGGSLLRGRESQEPPGTGFALMMPSIGGPV